jgi:hypothetical protein
LPFGVGKKKLAEKVGELTDFTNFGVKEKFSINTDRRLALGAVV